MLGLFILPIHGAVYNLTPSDDSYIRENDQALNFGSDEGLLLHTVGGGDLYFIILRYDISGYGSGNFTNASLRLFQTITAGSNYGITGTNNNSCTWNEGTITYQDYAVSCPFSNEFLMQYGTNNGAGAFTYWNNNITNYTISRFGNFINFRIDTDNTGSNFVNFTSKEGAIAYNISRLPKLILEYNGTATTPNITGGNGSSTANINSVSLPSQVALDQIVNVTISFTNTGNSSATYKVGFSIGNSTLGFCNTNCYQGGTIDPDTSTVWFAIPTVAPTHTAIVSLPFKFRSDFFEAGKTYTVLTTIRPQHGFNILANTTSNVTIILQGAYINTIKLGGQTVNGTIMGSSNTYLIGNTYPVSLTFTNNGTSTQTYKVGFSIGDNSYGFCNTFCYTNGVVIPDGTTWLGTATIGSGETAIITNRFKFRADFYPNTTQFATLKATIRPIDSNLIYDLKSYPIVITSNVNFANGTSTGSGINDVENTAGLPAGSFAFLTAILITVLISGVVALKTHEGTIALGTMLIFIYFFTFVTWIPTIFGILIAILTALLLAGAVSSKLKGG